MPTTKLSLAILCVSATAVLSGCNATLPSRPGVDSQDSLAGVRDNSRHPTDGQIWKQESFLQIDLENMLSDLIPQHTLGHGTIVSAKKINSLAEFDIWNRIRNGFELKSSDHPRIERQLAWYQEHPLHLPEIEERARPYLFYIVEALEKRGLPMELALLPAIESAFQPTAYSSQRAAGIWQFIPSTGKMLGLEQNSWYDGRLDIVAATDAALDYLQLLAERFDGDWELALAAYNSGEGTVRRAIQKNREQGKSTDYWSLDLPRQTRHYVPHLLALARLVDEPEAFGTSLTHIPNQPYFDSVDLGGQIDLRLAAKMADISFEELSQLNPGFNSWTTAPDGPHRLVLPLENIERFKESLAELEPEQQRGNRYRIRSGDTLGSIANRYGTTVRALKQANGLKISQIQAGRYLYLPEFTPPTKPALSARDLKQRRTPTADRRTLYTIRNGDSLWTIARKHNVNLELLAQWNNISTRDTLRPGETVVILRSDAAATNPVAHAPEPLTYSVRRGDTLSGIAKQFSVTVSDLREWNHLPGKHLFPGQKINLHLNLAEN